MENGGEDEKNERWRDGMVRSKEDKQQQGKRALAFDVF